MPRTTSQKKKLFDLYQIIYEYTDDNNGLTMAAILSKLQNRGIFAERRSIYDDIEILQNDFDIDIEARKTTTTRYHLQSREFEFCLLYTSSAKRVRRGKGILQSTGKPLSIRKRVVFRKLPQLSKLTQV